MKQGETYRPFGLEGDDGVPTQPAPEEGAPMGIITVGVDLAKSVFLVCELDGFPTWRDL